MEEARAVVVPCELVEDALAGGGPELAGEGWVAVEGGDGFGDGFG